MPGPVAPAAPRDHLYSAATRAAVIGLVVNLLLGVTKLVTGLLGDTFALVADSVNSLGDVFVSVVVIVALRFARRPPDPGHPYGHSRAEAVAASNVALLIAISALIVAWQAARSLRAVHTLPAAWTLWIAGANAVIKETLYRYKTAVGARTGSAAILANAWDHRSDALCSLAVLVGVATARWGGRNLMAADEMAALVVAGMILWSATHLFRRSAHELLDAQADPGFVREVEEAARAVEDVRDVETLWLRKSGLEFFADIHIEVDPELTVAAGHEIGHRVKDALLARFDRIRDVLVHLEPHHG